MLDNDIANILHIWQAGGPLMIPLAGLCLLIYGTALQMLLYFSRRGYDKVAEADWRNWILAPEQGTGEVGEIIRYTQDQARTGDEVQNRFSEILSAKIPEVDRRLFFLNVLVGAAPLIGLLGTVLGMLETFRGIAGGGSKTIDLISSGISEALITTEMGLLVALPGMMFAFLVRRKRNEYEAFLMRLESFTLLQFKQKTDTGSPGGPSAPARSHARPVRQPAPRPHRPVSGSDDLFVPAPA